MPKKRLTLEQAMKENVNILLVALAGLGINKACIAYQGCGDSGGAEEISVEPADREPALHTENLSFWEWYTQPLTDHKGYRLDQEKQRSLDSALRLFVMDWLTLEHAGWELNEGCQGTVTITVPDKHCYMEHTEFYTESEFYEHAL